MVDFVALVTPPKLVGPDMKPANGDIYVRSTNSIAKSGVVVVPFQIHGIIENGEFKDLKGGPLMLVVTPEGVALEIVAEIFQDTPTGRREKHSVRRTVATPNASTVTWDALVDVVPVDTGSDYEVPAWVTQLLADAVSAAGPTITAKNEAVAAAELAIEAAASVPTEAELTATIAAAIADIDSDLAASDFANSWWCQPRTKYADLRKTVYLGGVNAVGTIQLAKFDLRRNRATKVNLGTFEIDDHNVPAFLVEEDRPPLVAIVRHAVESFVRVRVGAAPYDVESLATASEMQVPFPGVCTYAHLIRKPGTATIALLTRNQDGWYVSVSTNWGTTWGTAVKFTGLAYNTFKQVGNIVHYVATGHPITSVNNSLRYIRINVTTGDIVNAAGTSVGNLWSFTTAIPLTSMTYVRQSYDTDTGFNTFRTLDVGPAGSVLAMQLLKEKPELGGIYGVYRYSTTGATPTSGQSPSAPGRGWTFEPIVASGVPVGYYESSYVGGAVFGSTDDIVWLARESAGTWTLERWAKAAGAWALTDTLDTRTNGEKLGRPQIPWGAEGTGLLAAIDYFQYPADTFMAYYGDQYILRTGVHDPVPTPDTTAPSAPTGLNAASAETAANLSWSAATDDVAVTGYAIYNGFSYVKTVSGLSTTMSGLTGGLAYQFRIRAVDAAGNQSDYSAFPAVTPASAPPPANLLTAGSLLLVDPTHPDGAWPTGVPTTTIVNRARAQAAAAAGSATPADFDLSVANTLTPTDGVMERTAKGGLHGIMSQATAALDREYKGSSAALLAYLAANLGHSYYLSVWVNVTRHSTLAPPSILQRFAGVNGTSFSDTAIAARLVTNNKLSVTPTSNRTNIKESATPIALGAPQAISGAVSSLSSVQLTDNPVLYFGTDATASLQNKAPSGIIYRIYLEDLTVSGRTYAQVDGVDAAEHAAAFGSGGRYAGDTYTAVSTLP